MPTKGRWESFFEGETRVFEFKHCPDWCRIKLDEHPLPPLPPVIALPDRQLPVIALPDRHPDCQPPAIALPLEGQHPLVDEGAEESHDLSLAYQPSEDKDSLPPVPGDFCGFEGTHKTVHDGVTPAQWLGEVAEGEWSVIEHV